MSIVGAFQEGPLSVEVKVSLKHSDQWVLLRSTELVATAISMAFGVFETEVWHFSPVL